MAYEMPSVGDHVLLCVLVYALTFYLLLKNIQIYSTLRLTFKQLVFLTFGCQILQIVLVSINACRSDHGWLKAIKASLNILKQFNSMLDALK
jgi:hypothetical protein